MDYKKLDYYVDRITAAISAGNDFDNAVEDAIGWAFKSFKTQQSSQPYFSEYNNLIRALAAKLAKASGTAVPRTIKIIYRPETEAFARARGYPLGSEMTMKYEPALYASPANAVMNYRKLYYIPKAKKLAEEVQESLHKEGYDVDIEATSDDGDYSLYLWIV